MWRLLTLSWVIMCCSWCSCGVQHQTVLIWHNRDMKSLFVGTWGRSLQKDLWRIIRSVGQHSLTTLYIHMYHPSLLYFFKYSHIFSKCCSTRIQLCNIYLQSTKFVQASQSKIKPCWPLAFIRPPPTSSAPQNVSVHSRPTDVWLRANVHTCACANDFVDARWWSWLKQGH